jgi:pimeloyl-ACP methyl ester carboxylesterase
MYRKSWRYYRDSILLWLLFLLMIVAAGYALKHPVYWLAVLLIWFVRNPIRNAFFFAHPYRRFDWMPENNLNFRERTFKARDGLTLFGRFMRGRNHATILLIHPLGSSDSSMLIYAEFLANAGYGVFMMDLRAHGSSDGDTSTFGLREADDVAGAVDYLLGRLDVNGQKIGVLGISLGAQAALRGALKTDCLRALVLEGLGPVTLSDHGGKLKSIRRWINYPFNWIYYHAYEFMIGGKDTSVIEAIGQIAPRPILLIASGEKDIYFNRIFFHAAREPIELWELPDGEHGAGILKDSQAYMQRVIEFFDKALL